MISFLNKSSVCLLVYVLAFSAFVLSLDKPRFQMFQSRIKPHRQRSGDLVPGEEHLRKMIFGWEPERYADSYELLHHNEANGLLSYKDVRQCAGKPCVVLPAIPLGMQRFQLRYSVKGEWSDWSVVRSFNILTDDTGPVNESPTEEEIPSLSEMLHDEL